jgi:hypothetical protein
MDTSTSKTCSTEFCPLRSSGVNTLGVDILEPAHCSPLALETGSFYVPEDYNVVAYYALFPLSSCPLHQARSSMPWRTRCASSHEA